MSAASWVSRWLVSDHSHLTSEPSGPGLAVALDVGQALPGEQPDRLGAHVQVGELVGDERVLEQPALGRGGEQVVELLAQPHLQREAQPGALVHQRRQRDLPAVADAADDVRVGDPRLLDEELVELRLAGDLAQRADLDGLLLHVHQEVGQALVLGGLAVGARDEHAPLRVLGAAGPDLLAGDDPVVAVLDRARLERREVGAGVGLGEALAPDLLGREDRGRKRSFCSSVPHTISVGPPSSRPSTLAGSGTRARPSSSK